jgi:hypothetical protein
MATPQDSQHKFLSSTPTKKSTEIIQKKIVIKSLEETNCHTTTTQQTATQTSNVNRPASWSTTN